MKVSRRSIGREYAQCHTLGRSSDNGLNLVPLEGPPTCVVPCQHGAPFQLSAAHLNVPESRPWSPQMRHGPSRGEEAGETSLFVWKKKDLADLPGGLEVDTTTCRACRLFLGGTSR